VRAGLEHGAPLLEEFGGAGRCGDTDAGGGAAGAGQLNQPLLFGDQPGAAQGAVVGVEGAAGDLESGQGCQLRPGDPHRVMPSQGVQHPPCPGLQRRGSVGLAARSQVRARM